MTLYIEKLLKKAGMRYKKVQLGKTEHSKFDDHSQAYLPYG